MRVPTDVLIDYVTHLLILIYHALHLDVIIYILANNYNFDF